MKKILSVLVFMTAAICVLAKDLTKEQMAVRLDIVKYLSSEGFQPKIDTDGDVKFVKDNINYYIIINDNWSEPFLLTLCKETPYNKEGVVTKENVESCISIIAKYKTVKLYCYNNVYSFLSRTPGSSSLPAKPLSASLSTVRCLSPPALPLATGLLRCRTPTALHRRMRR